jgi:hypothetical protein
MTDQPEMYIAHGTHQIRGLYVIFHETVYWFRILSKRVVISRLENQYYSTPARVRENLTPVNEITALFMRNLARIADPLAWTKDGTPHMNLARDPRPEPIDTQEEDENGN